MPFRTPLPLVIALVGVLVVIVLGVGVATSATDPIDAPIVAAVRALPLDPLRVVSEFGSWWGVTLVAVLVVAVATLVESWRDGLAGALTIALASIGNTLLKASFRRARPDALDAIVVEHGYSFPSGHSALSMVAYGVLAVIVWRSTLPRAARIGLVVALGALIGAVGLSRVWLGVHYPTDVVAGWSAGLAVVMVYAWLTRREPTEPAAAAAVEDPAAPRSDPPAAG
jgi:undecaprenyl-diphosphatase